MRRQVLAVAAVILVLTIAAVTYAFFKPPQEASGPIEAVPVIIETGEPVAAVAEPTATSQPTVEPTEAPAVEPGAESEPEPTATPAPEPTEEAPEAGADPIIFEIVQAESEARFIINEVLRGSPKRVVGATDQVSGQIAVDPANPSAAQVGAILVNARTLETDNEFRNRAIKNRILQTGRHEFVTFEPTELASLPDAVTIGSPFSFQIIGNLTIRETTRPVTFDVAVTPTSEERLEGLASTSFLYADFGLIIPDAPAVNSVEDDVTLELAFVAAAQ